MLTLGCNCNVFPQLWQSVINLFIFFSGAICKFQILLRRMIPVPKRKIRKMNQQLKMMPLSPTDCSLTVFRENFPFFSYHVTYAYLQKFIFLGHHSSSVLFLFKYVLILNCQWPKLWIFFSLAVCNIFYTTTKIWTLVKFWLICSTQSVKNTW